MPLFSSRPRADGIEGILQIIGMGECDDNIIRQLQVLIEGMSDDDVRSLADTLMANLVKYPDDVDVLTGSVKALEALPFMPKAKNEFIITLLLSLLKAPANKKDALKRQALKSEVVKFLLFFVVEDDTYARLMMPELISALDDTHVSSSVFHALQRLATERPEYFEHHSAALIKQLGSISKSTRAESAKLIGIIARTHPEYVCRAMPFLQSLASFYPDAHVKRNANEAYQIIWRSRKAESPAPVTATKADSGSKGFADIVKLNAGVPNASIPEVQFTDEELKEIIELTRKEFKSDAEEILNSLGVGHLAVNVKESRRKVPQPKVAAPEATPVPQAKPKKAEKTEKAFAMLQSGAMDSLRPDTKEPEAPKPGRPKTVSPEPMLKPKKSVSPEKPAEPVKDIAAPVLHKHVIPVEKPAEHKKDVKAPAAEKHVMPPEKPAMPKKEVKAPAILKQAVPPIKPAETRKEAIVPPSPKVSAIDAIMREVNGPEITTKPVKARGDPKAGRTFKCPKCGKHVWAEGQLCNACGAEEFDSMRLKGHYDIG